MSAACFWGAFPLIQAQLSAYACMAGWLKVGDLSSGVTYWHSDAGVPVLERATR